MYWKKLFLDNQKGMHTITICIMFTYQIKPTLGIPKYKTLNKNTIIEAFFTFVLTMRSCVLLFFKKYTVRQGNT